MRDPVTHDLKCWPVQFGGVMSGLKTYEIRRNDRAFAVGDFLRLREWNPSRASSSIDPAGYTGLEIIVEVTYMTEGGQWMLPSNLCVMAIKQVEQA